MKTKKINKQSLIVLTEPRPTEFGVFNGTPSHDEYSHTALPGRAIHKLQGILINNGWENVHVIHPDYHGKRKRYTKDNLKLMFNADVIGISSITRTYNQSSNLANLIKLNNPDSLVVAGGMDATFRQDQYLENFDVVVRKEALKSFPEMMENLKQKGSLEGVRGIAHKNNRDIVSSDVDFLNSEDLGNVAHPFYDNQTVKNVKVPTLETTVGCPNDCPYCGVTEFNGRKYRSKPVDYVINELKQIYELFPGKSIFFTDDNFNANRKINKKLLEAMIDENLNKSVGMAQVTVASSKHSENLELMRKAGINVLFVGIESTNNDTLEFIGKPYSFDNNNEAVKTFREHGFWVHGMMMLGGKDTKKSLDYTLNWAKQNLDSVQFFPIGAIPGTKFHKQMQEQKRILNNQDYLLDGLHVTLRPDNLSPYELQIKTNEMYNEFYSFKNNTKRFANSIGSWKWKPSLGIGIYTSILSGVDRVFKSKQMKTHLEFLKSVS